MRARPSSLQERKLGEVGASLGARGVTLTLEYSDTLHDRCNPGTFKNIFFLFIFYLILTSFSVGKLCSILAGL